MKRDLYGVLRETALENRTRASLLGQLLGQRLRRFESTLSFKCLRLSMAEREGFEPPIGLHLCRISSAVHSTTLPPLRGCQIRGKACAVGAVF